MADGLDEPSRDEEWLTVPEVARLLRLNEETVRRWIRGGELPVLTLGGPRAGYRVRRRDLDGFIAARYGSAGARRRAE